MDPRRIGFGLLLLVCVGIPAWVWLQRESAKPAPPPPSPGLQIGDWIRELDVLNDLGHPAPRAFPRGRVGTVVLFWHVQCPAVRDVHPRFEALQTRYRKRGFEFVVIDSEPLDGIEDIKVKRRDLKATYHVLRDNRRATATLLGVERAATFLVFDSEARLQYRGGFDDGLKPPKIGYVHQAISALLADTTAGILETRSIGLHYSDPDAPPPEKNAPAKKE